MFSYSTFLVTFLTLLANSLRVEAKLGDRLEGWLERASDVEARQAADTEVDAQFDLVCECECTLLDGSMGVIVSNSPLPIHLCIPEDYVFIFLFVPKITTQLVPQLPTVKFTCANSYEDKENKQEKGFGCPTKLLFPVE